MSETRRTHVVVHGRVQGVWFRDSTRQMATELGLGGWVGNRSNGTVEAVFEGPPTSVDRAVEWCHHGPDRAEVEEVEVTEETPEGVSGFSIVS